MFWVLFADYIRCTGTVTEHITFIEKALAHPEQVYPDVNHALVESLLRVEAAKRGARLIRQWAVKLLCERPPITGAQACAETAPLLLLRFGDGRSLRRLKTCLERDLDRQPIQIVRACAVVYLSYGDSHFEHISRLAARVLRNHLGDLVKMVEKIRDFDEVPARFSPRLDIRFDSVEGKSFFDIRSILQGRLLSLNSKPKVALWLRTKKRNLLKAKLSAYDKRMIRKLL
jgi:hypothetical protein